MSRVFLASVQARRPQLIICSVEPERRQNPRLSGSGVSGTSVLIVLEGSAGAGSRGAVGRLEPVTGFSGQ